MSHSSSLTPLPAHTHQHTQPASASAAANTSMSTPTPAGAGHTPAKASEDWMSSLKSQLSSLDSGVSVGTMALQDPSTPARKIPQPTRAYSHDGNALPITGGASVAGGSSRVSQSTYRTITSRTSTSASAASVASGGDAESEYEDADKTAGGRGAPTVTLHPALSDGGHGSPTPAQRTMASLGQGMMGMGMGAGAGLLPPRSMSLQTARPRPASVLGPPGVGGKGPGLVSRSTTHLVRGGAGGLGSGSEPSLIPGGEERGLREWFFIW